MRPLTLHLSHWGESGLSGPIVKKQTRLYQQFAEKVIFLRLLKNAQMQGTRKSEE
jgi:hypothetical protein